MSESQVILHVENDVDDVFLVGRAFRKAGLRQELRTAENGERAISYLSGTDGFEDRTKFPLPTVILLDWNMPLMSGKEFLVWLRTSADWKRLPVIVLTSSDAERDMLEAYDVGANSFVVKPCVQEQFMALVQSLGRFWLDWNRSQFRTRPAH